MHLVFVKRNGVIKKDQHGGSSVKGSKSIILSVNSLYKSETMLVGYEHAPHRKCVGK